ncbi:MAG: molybdate ABC transporter permease subunit [Planctomycetota bacterium]|jgi:molybdate transport system permease protein|nr:molybdate ABC transporter permease subunit [Planctomycetota bacterium]
MLWSAMFISLKTASAAIAVTFFLGVAAARFVAGLRRRRWKLALDGLFTLPLVLPPTVAGFFLLYVFGLNRPVGRFFAEWFGFKIAFSWSATVLAAVTASFPLMYRAARGAFEQVDPDLVNAARTLGLSEWRIFWRIVLPTALPGVVAGGVLAFARGMGEFGATAMIAGNIAGRTQTLPLAIYSAVAAGDMETAGGYVAVIAALSFIAVSGINQLLAKEGRAGRRGEPG